MEKTLDKITKRINVEDYSLHNLAKYFAKFDDYTLLIKTNKKIFKIKIYKNSLPHLIGLHYFSNSKFYKGEKGFNLLLNQQITFDKLKKHLKSKKNYNELLNNIKLRIEFLPMFLNTINNKLRIKKLEKNNLVRNTLLKGNYLLFKQVYNNTITLFPLLSLKCIKNNQYIIETFIVEDNISLLGTLPEERIIDIKLVPPKVLQV